MKKKDLFYLLKDVDDDAELFVNIFNEEECLPNSLALGGKSCIRGISKVADKFAIDVEIKE